MKVFNRIPWLLLAFIGLAACQDMISEPEEVPTVPHVLYASLNEGDAVKTVLDPEDDTRVLWRAGEEVNVFVEDVSYRFVGDNDTDAATANFSGTGPVDLGTYVMLSPYRAGASRSGTDISTTLPVEQTGFPGGYQHGTAITAGQSSTSSVFCRQLCSGIRFKLSQSDIIQVSLRGRNNEGIAGDFSFHFDDDGIPVAGSGSAAEVVLTPPGGTGCFATDTWYYIMILPTVFDKGITLTAVSASRGTGTLSLPGPIQFTRAKIKYKSNLDAGMWPDSPPAPSAQNTCYGPSNTFCLSPGESLTVDISPRPVLSGWRRGSEVFDGAPCADDGTDGYQILWNTGTVSVASLSDGLLTLHAGASEGSALVAVKKDGVILWSFLVWVKSSFPETTIASFPVLPPLGDGLYFQWGRKDPLPAFISDADKVDNQGADGLSYSISHPGQFIKRGSADSAYDWFCNDTEQQDVTLWGNGSYKTVWDPCPAGYRVPARTVFSSLIGQETAGEGFIALGYLSEAAGTHATEPLYWTSSPAGYAAYSLFVNPTNVYEDSSDMRYLAAPVRCVKE